MFPRKDIHKYTLIAPNGVYKNQIDHILINNRFKNSIKNIRTLRGSDTDSDHLIVGCWMNVKFKKITNSESTRRNNYNIEKLSEKKICEEYKCKIDNIRKGKQDDSESLNDTWDQLKEIVYDTAGELLGKTKLVSKPWFNKICEEAIRRRKLARQKWLENVNDNENMDRYRCRRKETNNILRCEKRKYIKDMIDEAETEYRRNRIRKLYQRVKNLKGDYRKKERFLKNEDGSLITTEEELAKKWASYFDKLLNCEQLSEICLPSLNTRDDQMPVFRGSQVPNAKFKESQIAWKGPDSSRIDKEWRR